MQLNASSASALCRLLYSKQVCPVPECGPIWLAAIAMCATVYIAMCVHAVETHRLRLTAPLGRSIPEHSLQEQDATQTRGCSLVDCPAVYNFVPKPTQRRQPTVVGQEEGLLQSCLNNQALLTSHLLVLDSWVRLRAPTCHVLAIHAHTSISPLVHPWPSKRQSLPQPGGL